MIIPIVLNHSFVLANTHQVIVDDVNTGKRTTKFHLRLAERQVQGKLIYFIFCVDCCCRWRFVVIGGRENITNLFVFFETFELVAMYNSKLQIPPLPFSSSTQKNLPLNLSHTLSSSPSSSYRYHQFCDTMINDNNNKIKNQNTHDML